ncbi:hypothetical protein NH340_JMT05397 [Sarcoptes scabiei]|nr:hypothetical protein NH340_JMT05397 [Sarcoptes scabiei]
MSRFAVNRNFQHDDDTIAIVDEIDDGNAIIDDNNSNERKETNETLDVPSLVSTTETPADLSSTSTVNAKKSILKSHSKYDDKSGSKHSPFSSSSSPIDNGGSKNDSGSLKISDRNEEKNERTGLIPSVDFRQPFVSSSSSTPSPSSPSSSIASTITSKSPNKKKRSTPKFLFKKYGSTSNSLLSGRIQSFVILCFAPNSNSRFRSSRI